MSRQRIVHTSNVITRPNNSTAYGTFTFICSADTQPLQTPLPLRSPVLLRNASLVFSWNVTTSPTNITLYCWTGDVRPEFNNVDQNFLTGSRFLGLADKYVAQFSVPTVAVGGISFGRRQLTPPIEIDAPEGVLHWVLLTPLALNSVANGQVKLILDCEY